MSINFPNAPGTNEEYLYIRGYRYKWDGTKWVGLGSEEVYVYPPPDGPDMPLTFSPGFDFTDFDIEEAPDSPNMFSDFELS